MKCKVFNVSKELSEVKKELYSSKFTDKGAPCSTATRISKSH